MSKRLGRILILTGLCFSAMMLGLDRYALASRQFQQTSSPPSSSTSAKQDAYKIAYQKDYDLGKPWPEDIAKAEVLVDTPGQPQSGTPSAQPAQIKKLLATYLVIKPEEWERSGHLSTGDQNGWLVLPDGRRLRWTRREAGLALVVYPDGGAVYLGCRCLEHQAH